MFDLKFHKIEKPKVLYFDKLDAIRFLSAMMVIIYHAYQRWISNWHYLKIMTINGDQQNLNPLGKWINTALLNGGYGVDIFFFISGFLITYLLLKEKEASGGKINLFKFYIRRSLRIWPLYYLIIILSPLLILWIGQPYHPNYMANIFFYNNFDTMQNHYWVFPTAHFWSLCIEEHFYIVWPLIILFIPNKYLLKIFTFLVLGSVIYRAYLITNTSEPWYPLFLSTFSRFDVLVIGAYVAFYHFKLPIRLTFSKTFRIIIYVVFIFSFCNDSLIVWDSFFTACFKKYFYIGIVVFAIINFLFNEKPLFECFNNKAIRYLGKVSFGIYVYGLIILELIIEKVMKPYNLNNVYVYWVLVLMLSIIIPIISYELVEKQFLKLKKRFEVIRIIK